MYYTYILQSAKEDEFYIGFTKDIKLRFDQNAQGVVNSTKSRRPLQLIYYEACLTQKDATNREKYIKTYNACPMESELFIPSGVEGFFIKGSNLI